MAFNDTTTAAQVVIRSANATGIGLNGTVSSSPQDCYGDGYYDESKGTCVHMFTTGEVVLWAAVAVVLALATLGLGIYIARNWKRCQHIETEQDKLRKRLEKENRLITADRLKISQHDPNSILGEGAFGKVYEGRLLNPEQAKQMKDNPEIGIMENADVVACKTINDPDNAEILKEVDVMIDLKANHDHVLGLRGLYLPKRKLVKNLDQESYLRQPIIVMEKMKCSLNHYLMDTSNRLTIRQLLEFCRQILDGMNYLEDKEVVHRDLATRNILLDAEERCLKVTDFGLSRRQDMHEGGGIYQANGRQRIAIPWNAIESLNVDNQIFSTKSDVWQVGVVFWEIFTLGRLIPFIGGPNGAVNVNTSQPIHPQIKRYLENGIRLNKPLKMAEKVFDLCLHCWDDLPEERPTFKQLNDAIHIYMINPSLLAVSKDTKQNTYYREKYLNEELVKCLLDPRQTRLEPQDKNRRLPYTEQKPAYVVEQEKLPESTIFKYYNDFRSNKMWVRRTAPDLPDRMPKMSVKSSLPTKVGYSNPAFAGSDTEVQRTKSPRSQGTVIRTTGTSYEAPGKTGKPLEDLYEQPTETGVFSGGFSSGFSLKNAFSGRSSRLSSSSSKSMPRTEETYETPSRNSDAKVVGANGIKNQKRTYTPREGANDMYNTLHM